jgi:hypothetical protein
VDVGEASSTYGADRVSTRARVTEDDARGVERRDGNDDDARAVGQDARARRAITAGVIASRRPRTSGAGMIASTPLEANKQGLKETRLRSAQEDVVNKLCACSFSNER